MRYQTVKKSVICDGCGNWPLKAYKCQVCEDFDLCYECNRNECHINHPMLERFCFKVTEWKPSDPPLPGLERFISERKT